MTAAGLGRTAIVFVVVVMGTACGGGSTGTTAEQATSPSVTSLPSPSDKVYADHDVTFTYPSGWAELEPFPPEGATWSTQVGPGSRRGYVEVIAYDLGEGMHRDQVEAFAHNFFRFVENDAMGDRPVGDPSWTTIAGTDALQARFERPRSGDLARGEQVAVAFADGTTVYGIDCYVEGVDPQMADGCRMVLDSFAFV